MAECTRAFVLGKDYGFSEDAEQGQGKEARAQAA